ncbi:MAG: hypothetical protein ACI8W7_000302, partial [Gammaproteobacteria bacterium]
MLAQPMLPPAALAPSAERSGGKSLMYCYSLVIRYAARKIPLHRNLAIRKKRLCAKVSRR